MGNLTLLLVETLSVSGLEVELEAGTGLAVSDLPKTSPQSPPEGHWQALVRGM